MNALNRLRIAGLIERAERIGATISTVSGLISPLDGVRHFDLSEPIVPIVRDEHGDDHEVIPMVPQEIEDSDDDDALDEFLDFALFSTSWMLDAIENVIARLELEYAKAEADHGGD